jgi:hypothetical protein
MSDPRTDDHSAPGDGSGPQMRRPLPPRPTGPRPAAPPTGELPPRRTVVAAAPKRRPEPGPLRLAFGLTGLATVSALVTAFLVPRGGVDAGAAVTSAVTSADGPAPSVLHVTRYVQLKPGQTAPPNAVVNQAPTPQPRVVVVTTRQSGAKP